MWVADMDFASPPEVLAALRDHVDHGVFGYQDSPTPELVSVALEMLQKRYNWQVEEEWLVWLPGLVCGLNVTCRTIGKQEDEVATFTPIYPPFLTAPHFSDRKLVTIPLIENNQEWTIDFDAFEQSITEKTKLLLLCNPHNPVGRLFREDELKRVCEICLQHDIVICSDEIHCDLVLDDIPHKPTASLDANIANNSITLMAPSKTYNIPGLGCSFAIIPNLKLRKRFLRTRRGIVPWVNTLGYTACKAAFEHGEPWRKELIAYLQKNRDTVESFTKKHLSPITVNHVEATYLAWFDVRSLKLNNAEEHFENFGVGLSDGKWFQGNGFVRLNFGCPHSMLLEGLERIKKAVEAV